MKTTATTESNARSFYTIFRDVYTQTEAGTWTKKVRREFLRITKAGHYVWQSDPQGGTDLNINESCSVIANLQRVTRPQYNYGKIWIYGE